MTTHELELEVLDEADIDPGLDRHLLDFLHGAFAGGFTETRYWHGSVPHFTVLAREAGALVGHIGIVLRTVRAGAHDVRVGGVQNLGVSTAARGGRIGHRLLDTAMQRAATDGATHGMLFCVPELEGYYAANGWQCHPHEATMRLDGGADEPIPGKNIAMTRPLADVPFPGVPVHLNGPDW